jgi:lipopolysaccharide/colanic/teichoic acid biosynthesis glycosyltransferase
MYGERLLALALFLILLPLMVVAGLIIFLLSRRPPIVKHTRIGQFGKPFGMIKLRTMWSGPAFDEPPEGIKPVDDPRVSSRFARFCRRFSTDELPQLLHVISGKMTFVGPRPLTRCELDRYYGDSADEVLRATPGLTGLWQVKGRSRLSYPQRRRLDLFLVRHPMIRLRAEILWRTIPQVIAGRDSW